MSAWQDDEKFRSLLGCKEHTGDVRLWCDECHDMTAFLFHEIMKALTSTIRR